MFSFIFAFELSRMTIAMKILFLTENLKKCLLTRFFSPNKVILSSSLLELKSIKNSFRIAFISVFMVTSFKRVGLKLSEFKCLHLDSTTLFTGSESSRFLCSTSLMSEF